MVDRTGLAGFYDIKVEFTPDNFRGSAPVQFNGETIDPNGPSIFTAVQEQLGLRLEPAKGPVQALVIESAQKPAEN